MKTLDEHDRTALDRHAAANAPGPRRNGIACPECGEELADSRPGEMLTSMPPKVRVACTVCDYQGTRVA